MRNPVWKPLEVLWRHQWAVVGSLAGTAFLLGIVGLHRLQKDPGNLDSWWWADAVYFSLRLFGFNYDLGGGGSDPYATGNWQLWVARFLAPASTALAVVKTVALSAASRIALWKASHWKGHAVVCGAGERGRHLALTLRRDGHDVIVVEKDDANDALAALRKENILVIRGGITDEAVLAAARVDTALIVVALTPSFESNLEVMLAAIRRKNHLPVQAFAYAPRAFAAMFDGKWHKTTQRDDRPTAEEGEKGDAECVFFDHNASAARVLAEKHLPDLGPTLFREHRSARILVAGDGDVLPELLGVLISQCQFLGPFLPSVTLLTVDRDTIARGFPLHHPQMPLVVDLNVLRMPLARMLRVDLGSLGMGGNREPFDLVFVACREDKDTLALATNLAQQGDLAPRVIAGLAPSTQLHQKFQEHFKNPQPLEGIVLHNLLTLGCESRHVVRQELDKTAKAIHADYVDKELAKNRKIGDSLALHHWGDLRGDFRESNRSQADHIAIKKCLLEISQSEETIELLAEAEHRRWMADRIVSGWRYAPVRNDKKRLHDKILPYSALSEEDREKDRVTVRTAYGSESGGAGRLAVV